MITIDFLGNPLNCKCTVYTRSETTDEFNQPTWSVTVLDCAIFEGKEKQIQREGQTINSYAQIAVKVSVSEKGMVYLAESAELAPPSGSQEILKVFPAKDVDQKIEGYWIWL